MRPLVLLLGSHDAEVLTNALVRHATAVEAEGDYLGEAATADSVAARVRALQVMDDEAARQVLLALGLGVSRGRPQG